MAKKTFIIDGIKVKVEEGIFEDFRILEVFAEMQEPLPDEKTDKEEFNRIATKRGLKAISLVKTILGNEKDRVIEEIAKRNKGVASSEKVLEFITKLIESNANTKK